MAAEEPKPNEESARKPIDPATRRKLQQLFEHGNKVSATGQFDYATDMYARCVVGDPGNPIYIRSYLGNLQRKYNNNKRGAKLAGLKSAGSKAAVKKSVMQKDWPNVIANGLEVLKINPWDLGTLGDIGRACEELEYDDCQLEYLKMGLDADINHPEANRIYARALGRQGFFDQAIECWSRVKQAKSSDEEAMRAVANLTVERTISRGGYETAGSSKDVRKRKQELDAEEHTDDHRLLPHQRLQMEIERDPGAIEKYIELADLYAKDERYQEAEETLNKALAASGGDIRLRERIEDVQLRKARQQLDIAEQKAREEKTEESIKLYNSFKSELNNKELEVYANRCDRYPADQGFKYELAVRLQRAKRYNEAIKLFQQSRGDLKRKAYVSMALGQCFTHIKQYRLAMGNFEQAAADMADRDAELKKECLYNAAKLALHMKDYVAAEKTFSHLAAVDFSYRDVAKWLDKLVQLREDGGELDDS